jgi:TatD DNase family protein
MIDTHCHLTDPRLFQQLDAVLQRCADNGVTRIVTIGTDLEDAAAAIELCHAHGQVRCAIGVHPNHSHDVPPVQAIEKLREMQADDVVVAIGEMGLDYHYEESRAFADEQKEIFIAQLRLASDVGKPVIIHCREAVDDTLAIMKNFKSVEAVFHCFTGTRDEASRIIDAGYLLGFTGPITFKKNDELREIVKQTPIDRILVETDAPYLTPEPMRKFKTNEPGFVVHTARVVAQVKGVSYEEIDRITSENAMRLYRWP